MSKTKEELLADFTEATKEFANPKCGLCHGRGYQGWNEEKWSPVPCACLWKYAEDYMKEEMQEETEKDHGVVNKIRNVFTLN